MIYNDSFQGTMSPDTTPGNTEEPADETITEWPRFERRPLLKALGIGAAVSVGSGLAAGGREDAEIHPNYGYSVQNPDDIPERLRPDHEVQLTAAEPNPEANRPPAFVFDPTGLSVSSGDIVQFTFRTPDHTVTAYHDAIGF